MREDSALKRWFRTRAQRAELHGLPPAALEAVLKETGLSVHDIDRLDAGHRGPQTLLPKRLQAAGLDFEAVHHDRTAVLRDLERTCARCAAPGRCQGDLERADGHARTSAYCPNTSTIESLLQGMAR